MENGIKQMFETDATTLQRLMNCNGSRLMGGFIPPMNAANDLRDEGNAAHWLAQQCFGDFENSVDYENEKAPNGIYITSEMIEHVHEYLDIIHERPGRVEFPSSFAGENFRVNCRADHISTVNETLYVDDFKYGWRITEAKMNWTLIAHAIGYCTATGFQPKEIVFNIVQPRPRNFKTWSINYDELVHLWHQVFNTLSNLTDELKTGSHCAKCHALATCPAAKIAGFNGVDASEKAHDEELTNDQISSELDSLNRAQKALNARLEALEELAKYKLINGEIIENYSVDRGLGNTTWKKGFNVEIIKALTGVDVTSGKMLTPNQAIKKAPTERKLTVEMAVKALTYRPETGTKLKRMDANEKAKRIFKP